MELRRSVLVDATPDEVFRLIDDVSAYPRFFRGITRWEPVTDQLRGVGARFRVLMQVGSIEAGGTVAVTDWHEDEHVICWRSERGIEQWGSWRVEPADEGARLSLEVGFRLAGPFRWLVERVAARIVGRNLQSTLFTVRRLIEHEHPAG